MQVSPLFRLDGCVAFVSAARRHLGQPMARALAGARAHVIINGRDDAKLEQFEKELRSENSVSRAAFDVADIKAARAFFGGLRRLDILLLQLTCHLAAELGPERIRVNALVPGPFPANAEDIFAARLASRTLLGRLGHPEEIGGPLLFLASSAFSHVTGAALNIDGVRTAW